MVGQLVVVAGPDQGRVFPLMEGQKLEVGRGQASRTQLRDPHVSRRHCLVEVDGGKVRVLDAGGPASTRINGQRISGPSELKPGDTIEIGQTQLRYQLDVGHEPSVPCSSSKAGPHTVSPRAPVRMLLSDLVGKTIAHYEVGPMLAEGKTGIVFQAHDREHNRDIALKVLRSEIAQNDEEMRRFVRAMKTVINLRHPHLVEVYHAGKSGPYCWIAMERVEGEGLTSVIERMGVAGMLDWRYALRVAVQIGRALNYAAEHKIVHRNVTPANILVRHRDNVAKLGDLMLAKALEGTLAEQVTRPGRLVGDLAYLPPERTRSAAVDTRCDVYGLGATLYALLTGRPPFEAASLTELIAKIRHEELVMPKDYQSAIPDSFHDCLLRALAKRPEDRHQTPAELVADFERIARDQGTQV